MAIDYFAGVQSPEEARERYTLLAKTLHPDIEGGSTEAMQKLNRQYQQFLGNYGRETALIPRPEPKRKTKTKQQAKKQKKKPIITPKAKRHLRKATEEIASAIGGKVFDFFAE